MKKILITGSGLLANSLSNKFPNSECFFTYRKNQLSIKNSIFLDITNKNELEKNILTINPDIIIHTAAITDLDWSEKNESSTFSVNAYATEHIQELAERVNAKMVFISTDSVFDGKYGNYKEEDEVNPINIYSKSKVLAENSIKHYKKSLIIRGTFFGLKNSKKESFFSYLLNELKNNKIIKIPKDKISNGMFVDDFSRIIAEMCKKDMNGIFHLGTKDSKNNVEFAKHLAKMYNFNEELIKECFFDDVFRERKLIAKRPLNTVLDVEKISKEIELPTIKQVMNSFARNYNLT